MRILIDIGHPAHVHYFRNFIDIMEQKGHRILVIAKDRNITHALLDHYKIRYVGRKDYPKSIAGKLMNIPLTDLMVLKHAMKFSADILIGFSGTHIAHAGWILGIPSVVIDDTDHARLAHASYKPFASCILTPSCFYRNFGKKQLRFDGYMELCYLFPKYFKPDPVIRECLELKENEKYIIMRFVSWRASHDVGHSGLSLELKRKAVREFSKYAKVFIEAP